MARREKKYNEKKGYNWRGYDKEGYNKKGYNKYGYDKEGYNKKGFDKDGHDKNGFNKLGYDKDGHDKNGFNKLGYDKEGYDKKGFDKDGHDKNGFNKLGYDKDGHDKNGFNKLGYDRRGYDKLGYNKNGFNEIGFNKYGYDKNGFDREGYDVNGFNNLGFNKYGYDKEGYNKYGYDKEGYDKEGYNKYGYDKYGFNRDNFNIEGFNLIGYDSSGYDKNGYDANGYNRKGYDNRGYDIDGFNNRGYDKLGYNKNGFNEIGFNKYGYDKNGFDREGYDVNGFNNLGYNKYGYDKEGYNKKGYDKEGFDRDGKKDGSSSKSTKSGKYKVSERNKSNFRHEIFDKIIPCVKSDLPVYIWGEAGSGKNILCEQIAEELELPDFGFTNAVEEVYQLTGYKDANGNYHPTTFYKLFTEGGLFLLDEIDASDPSAVIWLHAAIANRYAEFPNSDGVVHAHEDFRYIAGANTNGYDVNHNYNRRKLDAATLNRFVMFEMKQSTKLEDEIFNAALEKANSLFKEYRLKYLYLVFKELRKINKEREENFIISTRTLSNIIKMALDFDKEFSPRDILIATVFSGGRSGSEIYFSEISDRVDVRDIDGYNDYSSSVRNKLEKI